MNMTTALHIHNKNAIEPMNWATEKMNAIEMPARPIMFDADPAITKWPPEAAAAICLTVPLKALRSAFGYLDFTVGF